MAECMVCVSGLHFSWSMKEKNCSGGFFSPSSYGVGGTNKVGDGSHCFRDCNMSMLCLACLRGLRVEGLRH